MISSDCSVEWKYTMDYEDKESTDSIECLILVIEWNWVITLSVSVFQTTVSPSKLPVAR